MDAGNKTMLSHVKIYSEIGILENGFLLMENGRIKDFGPMEDIPEESGYGEIFLPTQSKVLPGFIDVHIHGVAGADTMDASRKALDTISSALPKEGTTSFLATTITQDSKAIEQALLNARHYINELQAPGQAEILGIHLEGPFINPKKAGAQPVEHIVSPNLELFRKWEEISGNSIKLVTLAPEKPGGMEIIRYLKKKGIVASIGHSAASYGQAAKAIKEGTLHITHLFNGMTALHHREPGVAGAALLMEEVKAEIIADGIHVSPEMVKLAYKQKGVHGLILITDSMRAKCLTESTYKFGGQNVHVKDGKAILPDGTLAGSTLMMDQAVRNMLAYTDCSLEDAIQMASENPAKQLNIFDRKGSITKGKDADLVVLDKNNQVYLTLCRGRIA
ncbi:N-acetylglucosamine-6-phosphate deacetylase [Peribacillus glennii]|uniref:N-acetylglucosamine-6-phosphate deacetylase n=1 Tax=Peribacillus glennii TaxID=2303991 RepID=A0A372L8W9_9BACI|nr:N-acetylglucosamine-6-phosphate deacetylase [Peribacillus glennii]RFU61992.1 N-acetylglucosamine-6-phosphate deacetylase [Peribacillus glennii]